MYNPPAQSFSGIGIVLLAAGASSRLGQPKQLLLINNKTLVQNSVEVAVASGFTPVVTVLGAHKNKVWSEIKDMPVEIIKNKAWNEGMSTSIKAGVERLLIMNPQAKAVILLLCDQPFVNVSLLHKLTQQYLASGKPVIASQYGETIGVPALFDQQLFSQLVTLQGDEGARKIIRQHTEVVGTVRFEEGKYDIDTMEDYHRLKKMFIQ